MQILEHEARLMSLRPVESYTHPEEIWAVVPHPFRHQQLATISNAGDIHLVGHTDSIHFQQQVFNITLHHVHLVDLIRPDNRCN